MRASLVLLPAMAYGWLTLIFYRRAGVRDIPEALVKAHVGVSNLARTLGQDDVLPVYVIATKNRHYRG